MWTKSSTFILWLAAAVVKTTNVHVRAQLIDQLQFEWNDLPLPYPVSDLMANYMPGPNGDSDGYVILTGGCDDPLGNQRNASADMYLFYCTSVTNRTLKFDPFQNTFDEMARAPQARYRHAATVYDGELWVLGGRDAMDNFVPEISSFNPETNRWTDRGVLPPDVVTSDLTAWTYKNHIYVAGGFDANYTALGNTYRIDVSDDPTSFAYMAYEQLSPLNVPRGDFHAAVLYGKAYLAGGISHVNDWCVGMVETEMYDMETDRWTTLSDLNHGRADMAVSVLNGKIVAAGGETKPEHCTDLEDPAYGSVPVDHVEVLAPEVGGVSGAKWMPYDTLKDERFRFAAATVPALNRMYHFGGQLPFDFGCQCFATSDSVGVVTEVYSQVDGSQRQQSASSSGGLSGGAIAGIVIACIVGVAVGALVTMRIVSRKESVGDGASGTAGGEDFVVGANEGATSA